MKKFLIITSSIAVLALAAFAMHAPSTNAAPTVARPCDYANPASGTYAETTCWIDFSQVDLTQAASTSGYPMTLTFGSGASISFVVKTSGPTLQPRTAPFDSVSWYGDSWYAGVGGSPVAFMPAGAPTSRQIRIESVIARDAGGNVVSGNYAMIGADARGTYPNAQTIWRSNQNVNLMDGADCPLPFFTGNGTPNLYCGGTNPPKHPFVITQNPSFLEADMLVLGANTQLVAFGFTTSAVSAGASFADRANASDSAEITIAGPAGEQIATASTGTGSATISSQAVFDGSYTFSQTATAGTDLTRYDKMWSCSAQTTIYDSGVGGFVSQTVDVTPVANTSNSVAVSASVGQTINCTVTNTPIPTAPDAPIDLTANIGETTADLSWDAPADEGYPAPITGYAVEYSSDGGATWTTWPQSGMATATTITGLTQDTQYQFRVAAVNATGTGTFANASGRTLATPVTPPSPAPTPVSVPIVPNTGRR